jgi:hypothetical protein
VCPPVRAIATSCTSFLRDVCSGAHEVNGKGGVRAAFPVHSRAEFAAGCGEFPPGSGGQCRSPASLWPCPGKIGNMRSAGRWQE